MDIVSPVSAAISFIDFIVKAANLSKEAVQSGQAVKEHRRSSADGSGVMEREAPLSKIEDDLEPCIPPIKEVLDYQNGDVLALVNHYFPALEDLMIIDGGSEYSDMAEKLNACMSAIIERLKDMKNLKRFAIRFHGNLLPPYDVEDDDDSVNPLNGPLRSSWNDIWRSDPDCRDKLEEDLQRILGLSLADIWRRLRQIPVSKKARIQSFLERFCSDVKSVE